MNPTELLDVAQSLSHGDWCGVPDLDPDHVAGMLRNIPNLVIAPMHVMSNGQLNPIVSGVAIGAFHGQTTSNRTVQAFRRAAIGSRIFLPTKFLAEGIVCVDGYVVAVPSMRFSSHAVLALRQE